MYTYTYKYICVCECVHVHAYLHMRYITVVLESSASAYKPHIKMDSVELQAQNAPRSLPLWNLLCR